MTVIAKANRTAPSGQTVDGGPELSWKQILLIDRPRAAVAGDDEEPAAALDESRQYSACRRRRKHGVVEDDDGALVEGVGIEPSHRLHIHLKHRCVADRQRFREVEA